MERGFKCGTKGHRFENYTEKHCGGCIGREYTADVYPTPKEEGVLPVANEVGARDNDGDSGTVQNTVFKAGETDECGDCLSRMGGGRSAWWVMDKGWICDSGEPTRLAP